MPWPEAAAAVVVGQDGGVCYGKRMEESHQLSYSTPPPSPQTIASSSLYRLSLRALLLWRPPSIIIPILE